MVETTVVGGWEQEALAVVESRRAEIRMVPIEAISVDSRIRQDMGDLKSLAESIEQVGLLHPVILDEDLRLLAGERRLRAHQKLARVEIEARIVSGLSALDKEILELDENRRRQDFSPNELARYYVQKKEYVEASLKLLAEQQRKKISAQRAEERGQFEEAMRVLELREEELQRRMAGFDARLVSDEPGNDIATPGERTPLIDVAQEMEVATSTIRLAERHVAAMDRYPFLDHRTWSQQAALEVAEALDSITALYDPVQEQVIVLLREIHEPKRVRDALRMWSASSPEKQARMAKLLIGPASEDRTQVEAYLAGNNLLPDPRRGRLHGMLRDLEFCCATEDPFRARFEKLRDAAARLDAAIRSAEENAYGWLR